MAYGIKVRDTDGNELIITPDIVQLYDGGREAMPASGTSGSTYQKNIDITTIGEPDYAEADIGVLADSFVMNIDLQLYSLAIDSDFWMHSWFMNDTFDFFTRNESTGVLTTWTPIKSAALSYDGLISCFPIAFWDKRGGSNFDSIDIFAGTCYLVYDQSASAFVTVYSLGEEGVENVDYAIFLRHYKGE